MADPKHLKILKHSVKEWNRWRKIHPGIKPHFVGADLSGALLIGADLNSANLSGANLSGTILNDTKLSRAILSEAILRKATLNGAILSETNLREANLSGAKLIEADLSRADLTGAKLRAADLTRATLFGADLTKANLNRAILFGADLTRAILAGASLFGADLSEATLTEANLQDASLLASRLMKANFDGANLTGACLWEAQRAGWSIKGVICGSIYWDKEREKLETYESGDFERLYSEKARVQIKYPCGISSLEIATLPGLIQHLEALHTGASLRFESIQGASGGAVVNLVFDDAENISPEQITTIQAEAEQKALFLRQALEGEKQTVLLLKGEIQALERTLERTVDKLLANQKPTIYLGDGDLNISSDTYNISGQAGAVGPNAQADDMTFDQIGSQTAESEERKPD
jgi:uncharacterized protein YjbI with pentapeptide repeats